MRISQSSQRHNRDMPNQSRVLWRPLTVARGPAANSVGAAAARFASDKDK